MHMRLSVNYMKSVCTGSQLQRVAEFCTSKITRKKSEGTRKTLMRITELTSRQSIKDYTEIINTNTCIKEQILHK